MCNRSNLLGSKFCGNELKELLVPIFHSVGVFRDVKHRILRLLQLSTNIAWPKRLPSSAPPKDTTTKVDKDANFNILTSEMYRMYRKVNELKAEN